MPIDELLPHLTDLSPHEREVALIYLFGEVHIKDFSTHRRALVKLPKAKPPRPRRSRREANTKKSRVDEFERMLSQP